MGRKPLPAHVKEARGNPGKRPIIDNAPHPEAYDGAAPYWLTPRGAAIWDEYYGSLESNGFLSVVDVPIFGMWCECFGRIRWLNGLIYEMEMNDGRVFELTGSGTTKPCAMVAERNVAVRDLVKLTSEIGMSPTSRTKVAKVGADTGGAKPSRFEPPKLVSG